MTPMELKHHAINLKRALPFIILFGVAVAVIAYVIASQRPAVYKSVVTYEVELINRNVTQDYQYGSYYDLKGSEIFSQHIMSLLRSPAVIEDILQEAGISYEIKSINRFTSQFRTDQDSAQHITVTFTRYTREEAEAISEAMSVILDERASTSQVGINGDSQFHLRINEPVIVLEETNPWLVAGSALLAGWLLAVVLVYLRHYFKSE